LYNIARTLFSSVYRPLALTVAPAQDVPVAAFLGVTGGFVVPTILMFTPFASFDLRQMFIAFWQPSPVYVGLLAASILRYTRKATSTGEISSITSPNDKQKRKRRQQERRQRLISIYNLCFAATTLGHCFAVYNVLKDPKLSLSKVFLPSITPTEQGNSILNFMQWDMGLYVASAAVHGLQSILEFRTRGYVTTTQAVSAALSYSLGHAVVGPAAAQIGLSTWKEKLLLDIGI
jgi:phosphate/sulfate permease